jgi:hypothetical protein
MEQCAIDVSVPTSWYANSGDCRSRIAVGIVQGAVDNGRAALLAASCVQVREK